MLAVAGALWALTTVGWLGLMAADRALMSDTSCVLVEYGSDYGEATWSWFPPGVTCTWDLRPRGLDLVITEEPPFARVGTGLVLGLWGATLGALATWRTLPARAASPTETESRVP
mgnify:CR=1 FL=1